MNNKELIEKAVYTIKEAKDSVDKLNEIFEELKRAYDNNELSIDSEEMQPILKWVIVISKEDALRLLNLTSRDNSRTPFAWNEDGGFTTSTPWIRYNQDIKEINVERAKKDPDSILNFYKKLISLRRSSDTLIYGSFKLLEEDDEDLFIYERTLDKEKYTIIVNMSDNTRCYPVKGQVVLSNYDDSKDEIRSWEAKVIKED